MALPLNALRVSTELFSKKSLKNDPIVKGSLRVRIKKLAVVRNPEKSYVIFNATTTDPETKEIRATQIQFIDLPEDRWTGGLIGTKKNPVRLRDNVKVRSSSPFYRFAFQYANKEKGALYGPVRPFKVKGTGRPLNPERKPGLDKHLLALVKRLERDGRLKAA